METPEEQEAREALRRAADFLAMILDTAIPIPGTRLRIGVDPLVGLLPGAGDALASMVGSAILIIAARLRVPKIVMARMGMNLLINGVVGSIPVIGDAFSIWFRSNARNADLVRRHAEISRRPSTAGDWLFVLVVILGAMAAILGVVVAVVWLLARLWELAGC